MNRIAVTPTKRRKGVNSLASVNARIENFDLHSIDEAFRTRWPSDAHFGTYEVLDEERFPRINKPALGEILDRGGQVVATMIVLDYDNNDNVDESVLRAHGWQGPGAKFPKIPWSPEIARDFSAKLDELRSHLRKRGIACPSIVYLTRHGARMIHLLSEHCPVQHVEPRIMAMQKEYRDAGVITDGACKDWTRLFRLPFVIRDGQASWDEEYAKMEDIDVITYHEDEWLDWRALEVSDVDSTVDRFGEITVTTDPAPSADEVDELLWAPGSQGRRKQTQPAKDAKRFLHGRDCHAVCFDFQPVPCNGGRDNALTRLVGEAVKMLHGKPGMTEELVFALFFQAVEQLEPDEGTPDWFAKAWGLVTRFWAKESAIATQREKDLAVRQAEAHEKMYRIAAVVEPSSNLPELKSSSELERREALGRQLILRVDRSLHVMQPDGYYSAMAVDLQGLPTFVRQIGMDDVIQLVKPGKHGFIKKRPEDLLLEYGTIVHTTKGRIGVPGGVFDGEVLYLPMYGRDPARTPQFSPLVDEWLRELVGQDGGQHRRLCKWIGYSLDFEGGPICALSIVGPPAVGKKLLARGLEECIKPGRGDVKSARGRTLTDKYNDLLRHTPFLVIDEGMPRSTNGADPADTFREMVSGEDLVTRAIYGSPVVINNPMRILMTANSMSVVQSLVRGRELTVDDQSALAQRILHFDVSGGAAAWLKQRGGRRFTDGWIRGDGAQRESEYLVAHHFMWLYENRAEFGAPADRLLVEGALSSPAMRSMAGSSGLLPEVLEAIRFDLGADARLGAFVGDGQVYFNSELIKETMVHLELGPRRLSSTAVLNSFKMLGAETGSRRQTERGKLRYWTLDPARLLLALEDHNIDLPDHVLDDLSGGTEAA